MIDTIFTPSFGNPPRILVGRDQIMNQFLSDLSAPAGSRERTLLMLGQRGFGKTVLLLEMAESARKKGYVVASPTVVTKGMLDRILEKIELDSENNFRRGMSSLAGGSVSVLGVSAGIQLKDMRDKSFGYKLQMICDRLEKKSKGLLILIDEVQASNEELKELIITYQEIIGKGQNISMVFAGLPMAISNVLNDKVLTFLNRAPKITLSPLGFSDVHAYYEHSFHNLGITLSPEETEKLARKTQGAPYLMQLIGHNIVIYSGSDGTIDSPTIEQAVTEAVADYENDICQTSLNTLSEKDIEFLIAMAPDSQVTKVADMATRLNYSKQNVQQYKKRLIDTGIIEQVRRGEIRFSIPYLQQYLLHHYIEDDIGD